MMSDADESHDGMHILQMAWVGKCEGEEEGEGEGEGERKANKRRKRTIKNNPMSLFVAIRFFLPPFF
jgi:hypothetical protein